MKKHNDYESNYGNIPNEETERMIYVFEVLNIKNKELPFINKMYNLLKHIPKNTYRFVLYLIPEASPRPRYSTRFHKFYVKNAKENNRLFHEIVETVGDLPMITTATSIKIITYLPIPSNMNRFEKYFAELGLIHPVSIPDWDNLAKTYCDMIQNNILLNDCLIYSGETIKQYSFKPRIEIIITYDKAYDCTFNKKKIESSKYFTDEIKEKFDLQLETVLKLMK